MKQAQLIELHKRICKHACELMRRKNNDYSGEQSVFGNLDACDVVTGGKCSTETGILIRVSDKVSRGLNIEAKRVGSNQQGEGVTDERFTDLGEDMVNYAVLLIAKHIDRLAESDPALIEQIMRESFPLQGDEASTLVIETVGPDSSAATRDDR